jgi:hypothetical protein
MFGENELVYVQYGLRDCTVNRRLESFLVSLLYGEVD